MMKGIVKRFSLFVCIIFVSMLSACGQSSNNSINSQNAEAAAEEQQADIQQTDMQWSDGEENPSGSDVPAAASGDYGDFRNMLSNPKLPLNYTFENYQDIEPYFKVNEHYARITRKDNKFKIELMPIEGEDKDKVIGIEYFDESTKLEQQYDVKNNAVLEFTDDNPPESRASYDPNLAAKVQFGIDDTSAVDPSITQFFKKAGEESVEGHPCIVFELKAPDGEEQAITRYYVSKEYNIILKTYIEEQGIKKTAGYKNFKVGQVTDDMVKPDFPKDATVTKQ